MGVPSNAASMVTVPLAANATSACARQSQVDPSITWMDAARAGSQKVVFSAPKPAGRAKINRKFGTDCRRFTASSRYGICRATSPCRLPGSKTTSRSSGCKSEFPELGARQRRLHDPRQRMPDELRRARRASEKTPPRKERYTAAAPASAAWFSLGPASRPTPAERSGRPPALPARAVFSPGADGNPANRSGSPGRAAALSPPAPACGTRRRCAGCARALRRSRPPPATADPLPPRLRRPASAARRIQRTRPPDGAPSAPPPAAKRKGPPKLHPPRSERAQEPVYCPFRS